MKERILRTLEAYLITNKDVLDEESIKDIEEQIKTVKEYRSGFFKKILRILKTNFKR